MSSLKDNLTDRCYLYVYTKSLLIDSMAGARQNGSPISHVAEGIDGGITELFLQLGNETRLAILLALANESAPITRETYDPSGLSAVPFSELRELVGIRDPGNFNYHLRELEGTFIRKGEDGYELLPAGNRIVATVVSIAGTEEVTLEPTEIDLACPQCGAPTLVTYQRGRMYHLCTECDGNIVVGDRHPPRILSGIVLDRSVLRDRSPEDLLLVQYGWKFYSFALAMQGICIMCSGQMEGTINVCDDHEPSPRGPCGSCGFTYEAAGHFSCSVCNHSMLWGVIPLSSIHPAGIGFCWEADIELDFGSGSLDTLRRLYDLYNDSTVSIQSYDPPSVSVTLRNNDDELTISFDEDLTAVHVTTT